MKPILTLACTLVCLLASAQSTIEFRISSVNSNIDNMDGWFGTSDPVWEFEILDGGTSLGNSSHNFSANCPGSRSVSNTFASRNYNCQLPNNFTFRWRAYEDDGWFIVHFTEANTGLQSINIPASGLNATTFTDLGTYTATASGDNCSGGSTVTWAITLQYRVTGSFLTNTAPLSITSSSMLIQTGQNVILTQIGGSIGLGSAVYTWTSGSCNGPIVGIGPIISVPVNAPTMFYVKSVGTCSTNCASIFINSSALGVTLSDYYYLCEDNEIVFHWQTESETNNSHFVIEQMNGPDNWDVVAVIQGHGTTSVTKQYEYTIPASAANNDQYYRLVQVDKDGQKTVYDPFYAACKTESNQLTLYPNPNNGTWSVYPFEKGTQVRSVRSQLGKLVPFEQQEGTIQLIQPEAGIYFVELISGGQTDIQKVVVE